MNTNESREELTSIPQKKKTAPEEKQPFSSAVYDIFEMLAVTTAIIILVFSLLGRIAVVNGDSMNNTLENGDFLIISELCYEPKYGDIVIFAFNDRDDDVFSYVKRVIATGGQTVDIDFDTWTVTIDGKVVDESEYANFAIKNGYFTDIEFPLTVPEGHVFVMGDNRGDSLDSRFARVGFVDERLIFGRVLCRIFPFDGMTVFSDVKPSYKEQ